MKAGSSRSARSAMALLASFKDPNRIILKATSKKCVTLKQKHLVALTSCTGSPHVSLSRLADLLKKRTEHSDGIVTLKALVIVHHLMCFGSENFLRYLAITGCSFSRNTKMRLPVDCTMGAFIEKYMEYLNVRVSSNNEILMDFCCDQGSRTSGLVMKLRVDETLRRMDQVQQQLHALLLFSKASENDFCSSLVSFAFSHIFEDLVNLFKYHTVLMTRLLEEFRSYKRGYRDYRQDILVYYLRYNETTSRIQNFAYIADVIKKHIDFKKISADFSALESFRDSSQVLHSGQRPSEGSRLYGRPMTDTSKLHSKQRMLQEKIRENNEKALIDFDDAPQDTLIIENTEKNSWLRTSSLL